MIASSIKFFGQYLLEKGRVSNQQLLAAVEHHNGKNLRIGAISVNMGFLTDDQVIDVLERQRTTDKLFGELAVGLGYLGIGQLQEVLDEQRKSRIFIGEAFVALGILDREQLDNELVQFQAEQLATRMMIRGSLVQLDQSDLVVDVLDTALKVFKRVGGLNVLIEDCHQDRGRFLGYDWIVSQRLLGDVKATMILGIPGKILLAVAEKMLGLAIVSPDELAQDAGKEFLNVLCGHICARLGSRDLSVDLEPPLISKRTWRSTLPEGYSVLVSLISPDSRCDLALVLDPNG